MESEEDYDEKDDYEDRLEAYADDLYDMMKNGDISSGQAGAMYQRAKARRGVSV